MVILSNIQHDMETGILIHTLQNTIIQTKMIAKFVIMKNHTERQANLFKNRALQTKNQENYIS